MDKIQIFVCLFSILNPNFSFGFETKDAACVSSLFRSGVPGLKKYKWAGSESSLVTTTREDGSEEIVTEAGTFSVSGDGCRHDPKRTFEVAVAEAIKEVDDEALIAKFRPACAAAKSQKIRMAAYPQKKILPQNSSK